MEIDRVEYDGGPRWPDRVGASMQLGGQHDPAAGPDNNDPDLWCASEHAIRRDAGDGDRGTPGAPNTACPEVVNVAIRDFAMLPPRVEIAPGTTVRWTNEDNVGHTVTSGAPGSPTAGDLFDSPMLVRGQRFEHTFVVPGEHTCFCRPHREFMNGYAVIVR